MLADAEKQALVDIDQFDELSNLCDCFDDESLILNLKSLKLILKSLKKRYFQGLTMMNKKK